MKADEDSSGMQDAYECERHEEVSYASDIKVVVSVRTHEQARRLFCDFDSETFAKNSEWIFVEAWRG